jgi:2-oxoglutarate ferredoxin oxidoreductase subunit beta
MTDDGFNIGVLFRGDRKPFQPSFGQVTADISELEKDFEL